MDKALSQLTERTLQASRQLASAGPWQPIFEQVFGAAFGLVVARSSIELRLTQMASYKALVPNLAALLAAAPTPQTDPRLELWSSGFYLNKAQGNTVAVVDRTLNLLLKHLIPEINVECDMLMLLFSTRARMILSFPQAASLRVILKALINGDIKYWNARKKPQMAYWNARAKRCRSATSLMKIADMVMTDNPTKRAEALAAVTEQVNWFKHHPTGAAQARRQETSSDPTLAGHVSVVQWCATANAFMFGRDLACNAAQMDI
jgi:hypothetical protein